MFSRVSGESVLLMSVFLECFRSVSTEGLLESCFMSVFLETYPGAPKRDASPVANAVAARAQGPPAGNPSGGKRCFLTREKKM